MEFNEVKEELQAIAMENEKKYIHSVYNELIGGEAKSLEEMVQSFLLADYHSKFGFDCGFVLIKPKKLKRDFTEKMWLHEVLEDGSLIERANRLQSMTIKAAFAEKLVAEFHERHGEDLLLVDTIID